MRFLSLSRIILFLFVLAFAWNFGGDLLALVTFLAPFVGKFLWFLVPKNISGRDAVFYGEFLLGIILFWILLRAIGFSFAWLRPQTQFYGTTKQVRFLQGIFAEVALFGFFFALCFFYHAFTPVGQIMVARYITETPIMGKAPVSGTPEFNRQRDTNFEMIRSAVWENEITYADGKKEYGVRRQVFAVIFTYYWKWYIVWALMFYAISQLAVKKWAAQFHRYVLRFVEIGRFGLGGSARFAGMIEEWALRDKKDGGLFMGRSFYNRFLDISIKDDRHMLTIAGSRAGKGTTAIIPNLLEWEGSALVIDPKGTNAAVTAQRRRDMGHDVYLVDPFNVVTKDSDGFNPFDMLDFKSPMIREHIGVIADALVVIDKSAKDSHWDEGAKTVIRGLLTHLVTPGQYQEPRLHHLRRLLTLDPERQNDLWADMMVNIDLGGAAKDAAARIISGINTDEIRNILSNANKQTEWMSSPAMQKVLRKSTFTFEQMTKNPTTIYLILPLHVLEEHRRFLRLFVNLAIMHMSMGNRSKIPVLMILDEFISLGYMSEVEKAFRYMAGYNLTCWPFVQDYGGLKQLYGASVSAFIANSRAVQIFGVTGETAQFVSEQIGERSHKYVPGLDHASPRAMSLRTADEVAKEVNLDGGAQYILRPGRSPLVLGKVYYFEDKGWRYPDFVPDNVQLFIDAVFLDNLWRFRGKYEPDPDYV